MSRRSVLRGGVAIAGVGAVGWASPAFAAPAGATPAPDPTLPPGVDTSAAPWGNDGQVEAGATTLDAGFSQNGWPANSNPAVIGIATYPVVGTSVSLQVKSGDVATLLMYVANQFNIRVERVSSDSGGYVYRTIAGSSTLSNHASGTAIDLNWSSHPQGQHDTFSSTEEAAIRQILAECSGVVRWGGDYTSTVDEMHFEINATPTDPRVAAAAAALKTGPPQDGDTMYMFNSFKQSGRSSVISADYAGRFVHIPNIDTYDMLQRKNWIAPLQTLTSAEITNLVAMYPRQTGSLTAAQILALP